MNRNLYSKELKRNRINFLIWSGVVLAFTILVLSIFPYMNTMGEEMNLMMSKLPDGMKKAMGIDGQTFNTILGMYNTYYGIYIIVILAIYSSSTAATIISKEEKNKTAEFLFTKPISRKGLFITKLVALISLSLGAYIIQTTTAFAFIKALGNADVRWSAFITMHIHGLILTWFFTCIGLFLSMIINAKKNFMGIMVGIVFGSYFINTIAKATHTFNWLGFLSPFHYLEFAPTDPSYELNYSSGGIMFCISLILIFISYKKFENKDISA